MFPTNFWKKQLLTLLLRSRRFPQIAVILGSGLWLVGWQKLRIRWWFLIPTIPHFVKSTKTGHKEIWFSAPSAVRKWSPCKAVSTYYRKGTRCSRSRFPRARHETSRRSNLLVSNAAGGINTNQDRRSDDYPRSYQHLMPNPLIGPNSESFGTRSPGMAQAYDRELIKWLNRSLKSFTFLWRKESMWLDGTLLPKHRQNMLSGEKVGGDAIRNWAQCHRSSARHAESASSKDVCHHQWRLSFCGWFCQQWGRCVVQEANKAAVKMGAIFRSLMGKSKNSSNLLE